MDLISGFYYIIVYMAILNTVKIEGIPITTKDESSSNKSVVGLINGSKQDIGVAQISEDNVGLDASTESQVQADGVELEDPTARIIVTVMKRSRRFWEPWELNYNVCPPSICTANEEQRPRGTGGSVFYNGDIILDKESEKIIYGNTNSIRLRYKRATMRSSRTWRNATVPYMFASDIAKKSRSAIRKAMRTIEKQTCIRFKKRKLRDEDYVRFISEPGCWSSVGRVGGEQKVSIGLGCERLGTAIHEISHALGFWHEQARPDRDEYVRIIKENISPRYLPDFSKANKTLVTSRGFPYDYESVMHYSKKAFTNLGDDTIKVIGIGRKLKMRIGQRDALSNIDIAQLKDMYKCNDKEDSLVTYCPKNWIKIGRKCYKFEDKGMEQFSGAVKKCDEMNSKLLFIDDATEDAYIKRYIKKKYPEVKVWRTGGRIMNGTFVWYTENNQQEMQYTNWKKGHPATYSSMALVYNRKKDRVRWEGVWLGSYTQMPEHAYAFICERRARRKCIPGEFPDGRDYRGTLDHTIDGYTCQKWSSHYPWAHTLLPFPYDDKENRQDGLGDHNYCRNPSGDRKSRPWCYTTKSKYKWQYCDVSICSKSASYKKNNRNTNPRRNTNKTNSTNPRRNTNKTDSGSRNQGEQKQNDGKGNNNTNRRQNNSNRRTNDLPETRELSNGRKGSSNRQTNNRRENENTKKTSNRKDGGRKGSRRDRKSRRRKNQQSGQNTLNKRH
ncbi:uncharacterized protein LOC123552331 [Mercenaria mercenaria]|uniref:uncharacterized protein LOC123552331 n=1 Tax=Mercenaria mercenaria TaxID=6596 RepID=UPI00234EC0B4|nr:uncharacterized protein LOC123552331 [Mercenaria mercenaria]